MKIQYFFFLILIGAKLFGQDLKSKIPDNSKFVLMYNGKELTKNLSVEEFDVYDFIKEKFLKKAEINSLNDLGIDVAKNHYKYLYEQDSITCFVALFALDNTSKLNDYIFEYRQKHGIKEEIKKSLKYSYSEEDDELFVAWNNKTLAIAIPFYDYKEYNDNKPEATEKVEIEDATDASDMAGDPIEGAIDSEVELEEEPEPFFYPEDYESKWKRRRRIEAEVKGNIAAIIFNEVFGDKTYKNEHLFKDADPKGVVYVNTDYSELVDTFYTSVIGSYPYGFNNFAIGLISEHQQYKIVFNGFSEKQKMKIHYKLIPKNELTKNTLNAIYNATLDEELLGYLNKNALGYATIAMDSEGTIQSYYDILRWQTKIFSAELFNEKPETAEVLVDFLEIMIDEKALAEIIPGQGIFVLNDVNQKEVEYTGYKYDDNYDYIEYTDTRMEMVPDFTIAIKTNNPKFVEKLLRLADATKELSTEVVNGVYHTNFSDEYISDLFYTVKDGMFVLSTSDSNLKGKNKLKNKLKKEIQSNNTFVNLDIRSFFKKMEPEILEDSEKQELFNYFYNSLGNIKVSGKLMNNNVEGVVDYTYNGEYKNGIQYFFDVINHVYLEDKKEREERKRRREEEMREWENEYYNKDQVEEGVNEAKDSVTEVADELEIMEIDVPDTVPPPPPPPPEPYHEEVESEESVEEELPMRIVPNVKAPPLPKAEKANE